jgi:CDGSH-type Zn-finger protein
VLNEAANEVVDKESALEISNDFVTDRSQLPEDCGEANICQKKSFKVELKKGETYYYCTCGKSRDQPFCDGSHEGTKFKPLKFVFEGDKESAEEVETKSLCGCKHNKVESGAFCDGSHKNLPEW